MLGGLDVKKLCIALTLSFLAAAIVFACFWLSARNDKSDIQGLAEYSAKAAYKHFVDYQQRGDDSSYWQGVADFRSFEQSYRLLVCDTNRQTDYDVCDQVYARLVFYPESSQAHIQEIVDVMKALSEDITDKNAYINMDTLRHSIQDAEEMMHAGDAYSVQGTVFTYHGAEYDLTEQSAAINAITDVRQAGDYLVIDGHVGPQNGVYCIFDTKTESFVKTIAGANLVWRGDDLSTAVYCFWSDVIDYDGNVLMQCDLADGEYIYDLSFSGDGQEILITIVSNDGAERTETYKLV